LQKIAKINLKEGEKSWIQLSNRIIHAYIFRVINLKEKQKRWRISTVFYKL